MKKSGRRDKSVTDAKAIPFRDCGKEIVIVRKSGVIVRVFKAARKGVESFVIAYYLSGKRIRETFRGNLDAAKARAEAVAKKICSQEAGDGILPMADVHAYNNATDALKPLDVPLSVAIQEYIAARQRIGNRPLALVQDHFNPHAAFVRVNKRFGNRCRREAVGLHQYRDSRFAQLNNDSFGASAPR